jgi:hypothetical protein
MTESIGGSDKRVDVGVNKKKGEPKSTVGAAAGSSNRRKSTAAVAKK